MEKKVKNFLKELCYDNIQLAKITNYEIDFIFEKAKENNMNNEEILEIARIISSKRKKWYKNEFIMDDNDDQTKKPKKILYIPEKIEFASVTDAVRYFGTTLWKLKRRIKQTNEFKFI